MKKIAIITYSLMLAFSGVCLPVRLIFLALGTMDSDVQLYEKFTAKTGIKVNVVW